MTCYCSRVHGKPDPQYTRHHDFHCCTGFCSRCAVRTENWVALKEDMAALLKSEEGCQHCQKARRINDEGKVNHPRQCWAHMDQRQTLALRF